MTDTHWPSGNTELADLIRAFDWAASPLGPAATWSPTLKTAVDLVLQSPVPMVLLWGPDGIMIYNDAYSRFAGGRHPRLLGAKVLEGWAEVSDFNRRVMESGLSGNPLSFQEQHLVLHRHGEPEEVWLDLNYSPVVDPAGIPQGVLAIVIETTSRVLAGRQLQERARLAALGADVGVALTTTNPLPDILRQCTDAVVTHLDAAFARIWTLDPTGEFLELQASSGLYTHTNGGHARVPVGQFKIGLIARERAPHLTNDVLTDPRVGDREWARREGMIAFAGYPLIVDGSLTGVIALFARHSLGQDTLAALESIANSVALGIQRKRTEIALREARDAAESANRAKSDFLASMSHELRTPLNAIIGYSEMLEEEAQASGGGALLNDLRKIHSAGHHLLSLISDVLDLSKIEAGRMELYPETFDVGRVLQEVATTIQPLIAKNGNTLCLELAENLGEMHSDLTKLRQSLFNLLSNAAKFTHNGTITLRAARQDLDGADALQFTVSDTGTGIPAERLHRLFQPFTQLGRSSIEKQGGAGLGLALTKRFCEMMGGRIDVESASGKGSSFTILLPRHPELPQAISEAAPPVATALGANLAADRPLVLVVDDDPAARELMRRHLTREDVAAVFAASGEEAIRLARELRPRLVTLDVEMPGMDGWAVLHALKSDPELCDIPVIMATIVTERGIGFALGAADYLVKPITREKLTQVLRRHGCVNCLALVVEDDPESLALLTSILEKEGCEVAGASDGVEALAQLACRTPRIILLDLLMPNMDGFEFAAELRKREDWRRIPIVVVTAKDLTVEDRRRLNGQVRNIIYKAGSNRESLVGQIREMAAALLKSRESGALSPG